MKEKRSSNRKPPVTLAPLTFERAVEGLLGVKPHPKKQGANKKPGEK